MNCYFSHLNKLLIWLLLHISVSSKSKSSMPVRSEILRELTSKLVTLLIFNVAVPLFSPKQETLVDCKLKEFPFDFDSFEEEIDD